MRSDRRRGNYNHCSPWLWRDAHQASHLSVQLADNEHRCVGAAYGHWQNQQQAPLDRLAARFAFALIDFGEGEGPIRCGAKNPGEKIVPARSGHPPIGGRAVISTAPFSEQRWTLRE
jgi:hypothetical protein